MYSDSHTHKYKHAGAVGFVFMNICRCLDVLSRDSSCLGLSFLSDTMFIVCHLRSLILCKQTGYVPIELGNVKTGVFVEISVD